MQRNHIDPFCREILETECRQDRAHYVHLRVKILVNWFINSSNTAGCKMPWGLVVLWLTPSEVSEVSEECVHKAGHTFLHWILLEPSMDNKTLLLVADYLKHLLYPGLQDHRYYLNPTSTSQVHSGISKYYFNISTLLDCTGLQSKQGFSSGSWPTWPNYRREMRVSARKFL